MAVFLQSLREFLAVRSLDEFIHGRRPTKHDLLGERLRLCASAGMQPEEVENFWDGIEELKDQCPAQRNEAANSETHVSAPGNSPAESKNPF